MTRRGLLLLPGTLTACSVLPDRPFIPTRLHALDPQRPGARVARPGREALLLRSMGAAPGLEGRGLRRLRPDGVLEIAFYEEWVAPPAGLAEQALRTWLIASGRFPAVAAPGTRGPAPLILETQLNALEVLPGPGDGQREGHGLARAGLGALLLREAGGALAAGVIGQRVFTATAPVPAAPPEARGAAEAAGMAAALGAVFVELEAWLAASLATRPPSRGGA
jgi:hypothetical protein